MTDHVENSKSVIFSGCFVIHWFWKENERSDIFSFYCGFQII